MRDDERFEIERAFDLLPHVAGASWATVWYRLSGQKNPTREEFRAKTVEYFTMLEPLYTSYSGKEFSGMLSYIKKRRDEEVRRIMQGENPEIEKRYDRYVGYG